MSDTTDTATTDTATVETDVSKDLKPKLDGVLSGKKYLRRKLDSVALTIGEDASEILRFCRASDDYNVRTLKKQIYIALQERVDEEDQKDEKNLKLLMEAPEREITEELGVARLHPIKPTSRIKIPWSEIKGSVGGCHITLSKTLRMLPAGEERVLLEQTVRDLEDLHDKISKKN